MNNKGFTLVELLMSIAILALILLIAVPSINEMSTSIKKNQRENLIKKIEIAASKYAFDTGKTMIFVDELVTEGYIESDEEDGTIVDPMSSDRMNCYVLEMEKTGDYYNAKFNENKNYDENGICNLNRLEEDNSKISILVYNQSGNSVNSDTWIRGNVTLKALSQSGALNIDCSRYKCKWTTTSGLSISGSDSYVLDGVEALMNTKFTFQITVIDDESDSVKRYQATKSLKIDNESPVIYDNEISVSDKFIYTPSKTVHISASDGYGSGIVGYYLGLNNGSTCNSNTISYTDSNKFTVSNNGKYLICVKDKVGNVTASSLTISYIG